MKTKSLIRGCIAGTANLNQSANFCYWLVTQSAISVLLPIIVSNSVVASLPPLEEVTTNSGNSEVRSINPIEHQNPDTLLIQKDLPVREDNYKTDNFVKTELVENPQTPPVTQLEIAPSNSTPNQQIPTQVNPLNQPGSLSFYDRVFKDKMAINVEQYYYHWNDDLGNHGYQSVTPVTVTYGLKNLDFGVRTAYIDSRLDGVVTLNGAKVGSREGHVGTWSDTSLSLAYTFKQSSSPIRLNVDFNLPTGKATLVGNERNALMDGSLVQQTRFGEGFNVAPGISISRAISKKDVIGAGVSYIFRGKFDPNGDVVNDEIKPGDETVATLQYQHTEKNWLLIGGLIYTNSGVTERGGIDYYHKGARLDTNATLLISPFHNNLVKIFGRYYTQGKDDVYNFFTSRIEEESANSNGNALLLGVDWSLSVDPQQRHTVHFLLDTLNINANSYDRINDLFVGDRTRWSLGLGYDYVLSPRSSLSLQARYFNMNDEANPRTQRDISYDGYNLYGTVNFNF